MTDIILGMGEVGSTVYELMEGRHFACVGLDADPARRRNHTGGTVQAPGFLHVCIPGDIGGFADTVIEHTEAYGPRAVLVHSTVRPGTAATLQGRTDMPVVSSPARGVHRRFMEDMVRYTKFVACDVDISADVRAGIQERFAKVQWMSSTRVLEMAKILTDTTYYGWLINYAQITQMICQREKIDYDEMWTFAEEIHTYLGNRPKMFPGVIGGHCVIPNLALIDYEELQAVRTINDAFRRHTA